MEIIVGGVALEPAICQVFPGRVVLFEQAHLPCTTPTFDLLFPGKRVTNVRELCSRWTSRVTWYVVVKPGVRPRLCSSTRRTMSFVTPTYSTRERLAMMYTQKGRMAYQSRAPGVRHRHHFSALWSFILHRRGVSLLLSISRRAGLSS